MKNFEQGSCIYKNIFDSKDSVKDWVAEGQVDVNFVKEGIVLKNKLDADVYGDNAHWLFWCPIDFPDKIIIEWDFLPKSEYGLCMFFFSAKGKNGESIFSKNLPERHGVYPEYHSGAINAFHLSYYRRKYPTERMFNTCNLRKSYGFHLAKMGADPIPSVKNVIEPYHIKLIKYKEIVQFYINDLLILDWEDNGVDFGKVIKDGKIGFRQMAPMEAIYSNLYVYEAILKE
ncbi:YesU family protein [Clostridium sp. SHJSY1]|uniref:DUF1961 family protein n=1 Tax=Clostridium sp. SHJSY1 TaxID=2942483 RepID=UPI002874CBB1|nr:DUF1961 family protein [Clostridium sp. SHJSY1]MDS0527978.1 YesU family protein [Clostridium sp. SHJSY1]